jgi:hypothetical protein
MTLAWSRSCWRKREIMFGPLRIAAGPVTDGFSADLVPDDGRVAVADYGAGPGELIAVLAAEQRYLVERVGRGCVRGATYFDEAHERIRRGPTK